MKKTIAELIDELSITNIKIFMLVEKMQNKTGTAEDGYKLQDANKYRSQLKNAINQYFDERQETKL